MHFQSFKGIRELPLDVRADGALVTMRLWNKVKKNGENICDSLIKIMRNNRWYIYI